MDTLNINHILVPIDFSESSLNALDTAVSMAKRQGSKLTLLHVINENLLSYHHSDIMPIAASVPLIETMCDEAQNMLGDIADKVVKEHGIEAHTHTSRGYVPSEICKAVERLGSDLVVMGTHGASGLREFFMGTNAFAVVKHATCPVLTVPTNGKWESFSRILFPVRDTPGALEKYDFLRKIIRRNKATIYVLGLPEAGSATSENWVDKNIRKIKSKLQDDEVECLAQLLQPTEQIAQEVLKTVETAQTDLIAITATLDYGIRDFFVGPYTQQIVNHARVPVLSIRPAQVLADAQKTLEIIRADQGSMWPNAGLPLRTALQLHTYIR